MGPRRPVTARPREVRRSTAGDDRHGRTAPDPPHRHAEPHPGRCPGAVRRAGLREDLAARDRRAARRHQGGAVLPLQDQGRHPDQHLGRPDQTGRRADRLGRDPAAHPGHQARGGAPLQRGAVGRRRTLPVRPGEPGQRPRPGHRRVLQEPAHRGERAAPRARVPDERAGAVADLAVRAARRDVRGARTSRATPRRSARPSSKSPSTWSPKPPRRPRPTRPWPTERRAYGVRPYAVPPAVRARAAGGVPARGVPTYGSSVLLTG